MIIWWSIHHPIFWEIFYLRVHFSKIFYLIVHFSKLEVLIGLQVLKSNQLGISFWPKSFFELDWSSLGFYYSRHSKIQVTRSVKGHSTCENNLNRSIKKKIKIENVIQITFFKSLNSSTKWSQNLCIQITNDKPIIYPIALIPREFWSIMLKHYLQIVITHKHWLPSMMGLWFRYSSFGSSSLMSFRTES